MAKNASEKLAEKSLDKRSEKDDILAKALSLSRQILELGGNVDKHKKTTKGEVEETAQMRLLKDELDKQQKIWDSKFSVSFWPALKRYENDHPAGVGIDAVEGKKEVGQTTVKSLDKLRQEIDKLFEDAKTVGETARALVDRGLSTNDLMEGDRQPEALRVVFAYDKGLAEFAVALAMNPGKNPQVEEAFNQLAGELRETIQFLESASAAHENVGREVALGATQNKAREILGSAVDNPGTVLIGLVALVGSMAILKHLTKDSKGPLAGFTKFITNAGMYGGATIGAVLGANYLYRLVDEDGQGFLDNIKVKDISLDEGIQDRETKSEKYESAVDRVTDDESAQGALKKLAATDCAAIAQAFDAALDDPAAAGVVDSRHYFVGKPAKDLNGRLAYKSIASVMELCATKAGVPLNKVDNKERLEAGLVYFKNNYDANDTLADAIWHLIYSGNWDKKTLEEGVKGLSYRAALGREPATAAEIANAENIARLFSGIHQLGIPVEPRGIDGKKSIVAIKGYVFEHTYNEDTDTHEFFDPIKKDTTYLSVNSTDTVTQAEHIAGEGGLIDTRMAAAFKNHPVWGGQLSAVGVPGTLIFDRGSEAYWRLDPPMRTRKFEDIGEGETGKVVPLRVYFDEGQKGLVLHVGDMTDVNGDVRRFKDLEAARKAYEYEEALPTVVRNGIEYTVGSMPFKITDVDIVRGKTSVEIAYGKSFNVKGFVVYSGGFIDRFTLPDDPELETARRTVAEERATHFIERVRSKSQAYASLRSVFVNHEHANGFLDDLVTQGGKWYQNVQNWLENDYYGRGLASGGKEWWENGLSGFKMSEYEYAAEMLAYEALTSPDPKTVGTRLEDAERKLFADVERDMEALYKKTERSLAAAQNSPNQGLEYSQVLNDSFESMDVLSYNKTYKRFVVKLEGMMTSKGFDFPGADGWHKARRVRNSIRLAAYKFAYPIPTLDDADVTTTHKAYLDKLYDVIYRRLQQVHFDDAGNIDYWVVLDKRVPGADFYVALEEMGFKPFGKMHSSEYAASMSTATLTSAPGGAPDASYEMGSDYVDDAIAEIGTELDALYLDVDRLERSYVTRDHDPFDAYLGLLKESRERLAREDILAKRVRKATLGQKLTSKDVREIVEGYEDAARWAVGAYKPLKQLTEEETRIQRGMAIMSEDMLLDNKADWGFPASMVAGYFSNFYEMEGWTHVYPNQHAFAGLMNLYFESIDWGRGTVNIGKGHTPLEYTNYWLYEIAQLLPGRRNLSITQIFASFKELDATEWSQIESKIRAAMGSSAIKTYDQWQKSPISRPVIADLDVDKLRRDQSNDQMDRLSDTYVDRYTDEFDLTGWFGATNREWQGLFKDTIESRINDIRAASGSPDEFERKLEYLRFVLAAEEAVYKDLITRGIDLDKLNGGQDIIDKVIDPAMTTAFPSGIPKMPSHAIIMADMATYRTALENNLETLLGPQNLDSKEKGFVTWFKAESRNDLFNFLSADVITQSLNLADVMAWERIYRSSVMSRLSKVKDASIDKKTGKLDEAEYAKNMADFKAFVQAEKGVFWQPLARSGASPQGNTAGWLTAGPALIQEVNTAIDTAFNAHYVSKTVPRNSAPYTTALKASFDNFEL